MTALRHAGLVAVTIIAGALAGQTASAQDAAANFNAGWDDPNWVLQSQEATRAPAAAPVHTGSTAPAAPGAPTFQLGNSEVSLDVVDGGPGARVTPPGGTVELGVGLSPRASGDVNPIAGFGALPADDPGGLPGFQNGVDGALSFSDTRGSVTQSLSLSAPLSDGNESAPISSPDSGFKTMFGLGMNF